MSDDFDTPDARYDILADLIHEHTGADDVAFDADGQHVYVHVRGKTHTRRYRLGQDAQRFLLGEFPLDEVDADLIIRLEVPDDEDGDDA
jgi:hypothetical protein